MKTSIKGYKKSSPDRDNPYNWIPGGNLTMKGVPHDVMMIPYTHGAGFGEPVHAKPGKDYRLDADLTLEIPMKKKGGEPSKKKAKEILHDGTIGGKKITEKQRRYFGWLASRQEGGETYFPEDIYPELDFGMFNPDLMLPDQGEESYDLEEYQQGGQYPALTTGTKNLNKVQVLYGQQKFIPHSEFYTYDPKSMTYGVADSLNKKRQSAGIYNGVYISEADMSPEQKAQLGYRQNPSGGWVDPVTQSLLKFLPARYTGPALQAGTVGSPRVFKPTDKNYQIVGMGNGGPMNFKSGGQFLKKFLSRREEGGEITQGKTIDDVVAQRKDDLNDYLAKNMYKHLMREDTKEFSVAKAQMGTEVAPYAPGQAPQMPWSTSVPTPDSGDAPFINPEPPAWEDIQVPMNPAEQQQAEYRSWLSRQAAINQTPWQGSDPTNTYSQRNQTGVVNVDDKSWLQSNGQMLATAIPAGLNTLASFLEQGDRRKRDQQIRQRMNADAVFNSSTYNNASRGDYETNLGVFRPHQTVPVQFAGQGSNQLQSFQVGGQYEVDADQLQMLRDMGYDFDVEQ